MKGIQTFLEPFTLRWFLGLVPLGAAVGASWFNFSFGWKLNWRLLVDLMVHKEFDTRRNGSEASNGTKGLSLLDLMLRLNGGQVEQQDS